MPEPLGLGLWEGVPLREVLWLAQPKTHVRRMYYYGYHNDDPRQRFQSSLPPGRVLEEPPGELPILLLAQPLPRPFPKSGQNAIQKISLTGEA